jgi:ABC-2 type transport system permease protein
MNGLTYQGAVWSIGIYFLLLGIPTRRICKVMAQDIRSGNIELKINKPINYIYFKVSEFFGQISLDFVVSFIATLFILITSVGIPNIDYSLIWYCEVVWLFVAGVILSLATSIVIGLLAFWMENVTPIYWVVDKGLMILGGAFLPIAFFPPIMKIFAQVLPFGAPVFVNQLFYADFATNVFQLIAVQLVWIIVFVLFIYWLYAKALKHLSVNGG